MARWRRLALLCAPALLSAACASSTSEGTDDAIEDDDPVLGGPSAQPGRGEVAPTVQYAPTAEANYLKGDEAYQDEEYLAAQRYFGYIRSKFPYSRYAVLSELRIADCQFARKRWLEAIDSYQNFVRLHPTHEKVPYAMFRVGVSYHRQIPSEWFLLPPAHEKDQASVRDAARALADYVQRFPDDENHGEAKELLDDVRRRLMAHERYVADFYKRLDKNLAYVGRLETIRTKFPDVGATEELLLEIVEAWVEVGRAAEARNAAAELEKKFPGSESLGKAKEALQSLPATPEKDAAEPAPAGAAPEGASSAAPASEG